MELHVEPRAVLGKKVRALRRQGITPVHVFGPGFPSAAFQAPTAELRRVIATAGRHALVQIAVPGTGRGARTATHNVMIHDVQRDPQTGELLHVDLYRVEMSHPVHIDVPVVLIGTSPAVEELHGTLVHGANTISIQALPADVPAA